MKIAMACDHGGLRLKNVLKEDLEKNGYEVVDFGTYKIGRASCRERV